MNGIPSSTQVDAGKGISDQQPRAPSGLLRRIARTVLATAIVVVALLCFPSHLPWMVAFWLAWHSVATLKHQPGWVPLVACVIILAIKRVYWPPTLFLFVGFALIVALWRATTPLQRWLSRYAPFVHASRTRQARWIPTLCLWGLGVAFAIQWHTLARCDHAVQLDPDRPVVCLGDSLTSGLLPDRGYPDVLQQKIKPPVLNFGQSGMATQGGLNRIARLQQANPQVVIIELGGHDFLQGRSRAETKKNLEQLILACQAMKAEVVLMEIPRGFMTDPFAGLERQLADEHDLELVPDSAVRQLVLWSPISPPGMWIAGSHLSDDGIHTNARGSRFVAQLVADALVRMYGAETLNTRDHE